MKCFNHESADAVGVCRACGRGTCPACLILVDNVVACGEACAKAVGEINALVNRTAPRMRATHKTQGIVFLVISFLCALGSIAADGVGRGVMLTVTGLLLLASLCFFRLAAMYKEPSRKANLKAESET